MLSCHSNKTNCMPTLIPGDTYNVIKARFETKCAKIQAPFVFALWSNGGEMMLFTHANFRAQFRHMIYYQPAVNRRPAQMNPFIPRWLADVDMKTCDEIVIDPSRPPGPLHGVFNQFPGFKAAKLPQVPDADVDGLVQPIMRHVLDVIVAGHGEKAEWFLNWMAVQVQHAQRKHKVAVVVNGASGCGKSVLTDFFSQEVLGPNCSYQTTEAKRDVFAKFAFGVVCTVFLHVKQEVVALGRERAALNDLITQNSIHYEERRKDRRMMENLMHVYLTTRNTTEDMLCHRYVLFQASNVYVGDTSYFTGLRAHLTRPEVARAFYQFLMARDLSQFHPYARPPMNAVV